MAASTSQKEHAALALLARAHSPPAASEIFRDKVQKRPLLLRPSSPDPKDNAREARRRLRQQKALSQRRSKKQKPKPLSAKEKRRLAIYDIPKEQRKYSIYEPMQKMWEAYARDILGIDTAKTQEGKERPVYLTPAGAGPMLASADFHGAGIEVVRSRCVSRVGIRGVVVKDQKFSFEIITRNNEVKTVPKEHTIFKFELPIDGEQASRDDEAFETRRALVFELHGSQFENRAPDRANKKFKLHIDPDL